MSSDRSNSPSPRSRSSSRAESGREIDIPSSSVKSKAQEALERKKSLKSGGGVGIGGDSERRRELLRLRQQARDQSIDETDSNVRSSGGSQRPRSPIRQLSKRQSNINEENEKQIKPEDFIDEYVDLTTFDNPKHVFPLSILPVSRNTEISTQPLLVIPAPHPGNVPLCVNYRPSCTTIGKTTELELLTGDGLVQNIGSTHDSELDKLLQKDASKINNADYYGDVCAEDGLYTGQMPSMTNVLMSAETLSQQISSVFIFGPLSFFNNFSLNPLGKIFFLC
jgi:hypothetical protein